MEHISYKISGGSPIVGTIKCMGAKNLATKAILAAILSTQSTTLHNVPDIGDVEITIGMLQAAGAKIHWKDTGELHIDSSNITKSQISLPDSRTNRIPILLLSILLQRFTEVSVPVVGGDNIGMRNINFHLHALKNFGAKVEKRHDSYHAYRQGKLQGCCIELPYPSVGATETCIFLGVLAEGTTVIKNAAMEPEIIELIAMLCSMGASIFIGNNREITLVGREKLDGTNFYIVGDRIEAASWACLAGASNGNITVSGISPGLMCNFLPHYSLLGGGYKILDTQVIEFYRKDRLNPTYIETDVFPGFATDWQQPFAVMLTQAQGVSVIHETVYEKRFGYLQVLQKLGAVVQLVSHCFGSLPCRYKGSNYNHSALINGITPLKAIEESIEVPDIRAGLAYLIAAAVAKGTTTLTSAEQIERGYGNLNKKLIDTNLNLERKITILNN